MNNLVLNLRKRGIGSFFRSVAFTTLTEQSNIEKEKRNQMLIRIKELATEIPAFNSFYVDSDRVMHLETVCGSAYTIGIYSDMNMSIAKTVFEANTELKPHYHPEKERVAVLEGELEITLCEKGGDAIVVLPQYGSLDIAPGVLHFCRNKVKTVIIADLMPYSEFFPKPICQ